ncbi:hypothetical protein EMEDMD4_220116 [Sinorhizobium medicae]|uniref:Uncharacterized protein n=1 Tax=Sinorhizobium medicae TaxID=110321 RepID=A0A508WYF1_9HYPH|nr:hypothetical protein EMEDMD4_220116 [Sinorhizobium medicae]
MSGTVFTRIHIVISRIFMTKKTTFDKYGLPDNDLIRKSGGSWLQGQVSYRWGPRMTLKQAVSGWRE